MYAYINAINPLKLQLPMLNESPNAIQLYDRMSAIVKNLNSNADISEPLNANNTWLRRGCNAGEPSGFYGS
jgi:hypothetical protein